MDQSTVFTSKVDVLGIQSEMARVQQIISNHNDRLARLEQRQDDDARTKSIWSTTSPFPGVLGGTPQQGPVSHPPAEDAFSGFDDQSSHLLGSLHLDAEEEPRRVGATSRANSVRFDETANQGHWSHPNRSSLDLFPRSGSSLSLHPMMERTYSHKSDGRQSSAGQSVHSAASRANSIGIDTLNGLATNGLEVPSFSPGLFHIGSCPAIIRCWLTTKFKNDTLMYAAICSGSCYSLLDKQLVEQLDFGRQVRVDEDGVEKIKLNVYLPEAVLRSNSFRSNSPVPQLPSIIVDFTIISNSEEKDKSISIIIGSDALKTHNADILFSSNRIVLFDEDQAKLSVPLVRPEDAATYSFLQTRGYSTQHQEESELIEDATAGEGAESVPPVSSSSITSVAAPESSISNEDTNLPPQLASREPLSVYTSQDMPPSDSSQPQRQQPTSPAMWGNWRREQSEKQAPQDVKPGAYKRGENGIKVFRPGQKQTTRNFSPSVSSADGTKETKASGSNPVGEGSAFSWLAK